MDLISTFLHLSQHFFQRLFRMCVHLATWHDTMNKKKKETINSTELVHKMIMNDRPNERRKQQQPQHIRLGKNDNVNYKLLKFILFISR